MTAPDLAPTDAPPEAPDFPCSAAQQRCWIINALAPGTPALNVSVRWEAKGRLSASSVRQAMTLIAERHEVLRTRFITGPDGKPLQQVLPAMPVQVDEIDLTMLTPEQREARLAEASLMEARKSFDLVTPPLFRVTLLKLSADTSILAFTFHQSVFDGWSIRVLGREFGAAAAAFEAGETPALPGVQLQYADYALWQQAWMSSDAFQDEIGYWRKALDGAPYFTVPPDHPPPPKRTSNSAMASIALASELGAGLEALARRLNVSFFALNSAILAACLQRATGAQEVSFATQVAGRDDTMLEDLIGVFINNVVLRIPTLEGDRFADLAVRANETAREAMRHQNAPFQNVVEALNPLRDLARTPLISVSMTVGRAFMEDRSFGPFSLRGIPSPTPGAYYDLNFQMIGRESGWRVSLEYNTDLFDSSTIDSLLATWRAIAEAVAAEPDRPLSAFPEPRRRAIAPSSIAARVESLLADHPNVAEAAVRSGHGGDELQAFVVAVPGTLAPLETLPALLQTYLAECDPALAGIGVSILLALPKTSSGGVNRAALPLAPRRVAAAPAHAAPAERSIARDPVPQHLYDRISDIWREILGPSTLEPNSNFFDLGGNSLSAVRLSVRVRGDFDVRLDPSHLFATPTLKRFAELVSSLRAASPTAQSPAPWRVVRIAQGEGRAGVVALNNTMLYRELARRLGPDRSFVGVQLFDTSTPTALPPRSFEAIAADYVRLVREAQPQGPYVLIGLCVAGCLAIETARQLKEAGESVPIVIALDSLAPHWRKRMTPIRGALVRVDMAARSSARRLKRLQAGEVTFVAFLSMYGFVRKLKILEAAAAVGLIRAAPKVEDWENRWFLDHLQTANRDRSVKPYDGDVVLACSDETPSGRLYPADLGWGSDLPRARVVRLPPCSHMTMCEAPAVDEIVDALRPTLAAADAAIAPAPR